MKTNLKDGVYLDPISGFLKLIFHISFGVLLVVSLCFRFAQLYFAFLVRRVGSFLSNFALSKSSSANCVSCFLTLAAIVRF